MPTFRALSVTDVYELGDLADAVQAEVEAAYPEVFATNEDGSLANPTHPRRVRAAQRIHIEGEIIPAVLVAWEGDDTPTAAALMRDYQALMEYARAVRKVNPFLTALPEPREEEGNAVAPVG